MKIKYETIEMTKMRLSNQQSMRLDNIDVATSKEEIHEM